MLRADRAFRAVRVCVDVVSKEAGNDDEESSSSTMLNDGSRPPGDMMLNISWSMNERVEQSVW